MRRIVEQRSDTTSTRWHCTEKSGNHRVASMYGSEASVVISGRKKCSQVLLYLAVLRTANNCTECRTGIYYLSQVYEVLGTHFRVDSDIIVVGAWMFWPMDALVTCTKLSCERRILFAGGRNEPILVFGP